MNIVLGAAGAVVGGMIGGPMGAKIGWMAGSAIGGAMMAEDVNIEGPRLNNANYQSNNNGMPINEAWGKFRTSGNVIWVSPFIEKKTVTEQGGKGGPTQTTTTYSYFISMAVAIQQGDIDDVVRIWANKELMYDSSRVGTYKGYLSPYLTIYKGTEDQLPDPTIQQYEGNLTPAFRDLSYVVFENLPLSDKFNGQPPNFEFEILRKDTENVTGDFAIVNISVPTEPTAKISQVFSNKEDNNFYAIEQKDDGINIIKAMEENFREININFIPNITGFDDKTNNRSILTFNGEGNIVIFQNDIVYLIDKNTLNYKQYLTPYTLNDTLNVFSKNDGGIVAFYKTTNQSYKILDLVINNNGLSFNESNFTLTQTTAENDIICYSGNSSFYFITYDLDDNNNIDYTKPFLNSGSIESGIIIEKRMPLFYTYHRATSIFYDNGDIIATFDYGVNHTIKVTKIDLATNSILNNYFLNIENNTSYQYLESVYYVNNKVYTSFVSPTRNAFTFIDVTNGNENYKTFDKVSYDNTILKYGLQPNTIIYNKVHNDCLFLTESTENYKAVLYNVVRNETDVYRLDLLVTDICRRAGLTEDDIDTEELRWEDVKGFQRVGQMTARQLLETLSIYYNFDGVETNGRIKFTMRGKDYIAEIDETELGASIDNIETDNVNFKTARTQEQELFKVLNIIYYDYNKDYEQNTQEARRYIGTTDNINTIEAPIVLTANEAKKLVDRIMYQTWVNRDTYEFETDNNFIFAEPGDVVLVKRKGQKHYIRITHKEEGQGVIKWKGINELKTIYTQYNEGSTGKPSIDDIIEFADTSVYVLDIPIFDITDNNSGNYVVVDKKGDGIWRGGVVYKSNTENGNYTNQAAFDTASVTGKVVDFYDSNHELNTIDYLSFIKIETQYDLESITKEDLLNGGNLCLIGDELLQFMDAELVAPNTYILRKLLRGRFATENHIGELAIDKTFILFNFNNSSIKRINKSDYAFGVAKYYKGVTYTQSIAEVMPTTFTNNAIGLKPYSVINVIGNRNHNKDLYVEFKKRIRGQAVLNNSFDPTDPDGDVYNIDIIKNSKTIRTIETTQLNFTYTAAQQIQDFGSLQNNITLSIYKVNPSFGRGFAKTLTI